MPKPPRTPRDVANAFQQAVGALREAWKSNEKISKARDATLKRYCLHAPGDPHAGNHTWRVLTEEPYFQAPGDEKRINITDREFTIVDLIKKCPDFIEEFGSEPGRADTLRQVRPSTDDAVSDLQNELLRSLREAQRLKDQNAALTERIAELEQENEELKETDDKATVQRQLEKWEKKCAKPGANKNMCKQKIDLLKARLKKLNEDSSDNTLEEKAGEKKTKWVIDGDTVLCDEGCTEEEAKARIKKRADAREKGKSRGKGDEMNEGWTKKKDQLLFERLVKKWAK